MAASGDEDDGGFLEACRSGDVELVAQALQDDVGHVFGSSGALGLHVACANGHKGVLRVLLENGTTVTAAEALKLMSVACDTRRFDLARLLIEKTMSLVCTELRENATLCAGLFKRAVGVLDLLLKPNGSREADGDVLRKRWEEVFSLLLSLCWKSSQSRSIFYAIARSQHGLWEMEIIRQLLGELAEQSGRQASEPEGELESDDAEGEWRELVLIRDEQLKFALEASKDLSEVLPDRSAVVEALMLLKYEIKNDSSSEIAWSGTLASAYEEVSAHFGEELDEVDEWFIPSYKLDWNPESAGEGSFGSVHFGRLQMRNDDKQKPSVPVAVKLLKMYGLGGARSSQAFFCDLKVWYDLPNDPEVVKDAARRHHPHILKLHGACHASRRAFLVVEAAERGNLLEYLRHPDHATKMWQLLLDAAVGLQYLHNKKVVHGHLTCANIVVTSDERAKLADFGFHDVRSAMSAANGSSTSSRHLQWMAPECLSAGEERLSYESDVYALGMCILEAVVEGPP